MGRFAHKLNLMLWKDFCIVKNNKFELSVSIILPLLLGFIGIGLRVSENVRYIGTEYYSTVSLEIPFSKVVRLINGRREAIEKNIGRNYHSVYCPQFIVAFGSTNLSKFESVYKGVEAEAEKFNLTFLYFNSCTELKKSMQREHYLYGICFKSDADPRNLIYDLIVPAEMRDYSVSFISDSWLSNSNTVYQIEPLTQFHYGNEGGLGSIREGTAYIQNLIAIAHMKKFSNSFEYNQIKVGKLTRFMCKYDPLLREKAISVTSIIILGYLFPSVVVVTLCVYEKESGVRSYMVVKGINVPIQLFAWCIILWLITAFISIITTIMFKIAWKDGEAIMTHTDFLYLLVFLLGYCFANSSFCMMISAVCSSKDKAIPFLTLCWLLSFVMYLHNRYNNPFASYIGFWLFIAPNTLTANVMHHTLHLESINVGCRFKQLFDFEAASIAFYTLLFSGFLFFFLAWVLNGFKPGLYGDEINLLQLCKHKVSKRKWFHRIFKSYSTSAPATFMSENRSSTPSGKFMTFGEPSSHTVNLTKSFAGKALFSNFFLTLYRDEILACIGPNGSGKTVLSLILSGLSQFESGFITINDIDLKNHTQEAMEDVAVVIGTQLMISDITLIEQLIFYARLYGVKEHHAWNIANNMLSELQLDKYAQVLTSKLPFTLKRTLAILCAFCGRKSIIILDSIDNVLEGPSGRQMCEFIITRRSNKTIFITTSSPSIATIIGTRLVFLYSGNIITPPNTEFLRKSFGGGTILLNWSSGFKFCQSNNEFYLQSCTKTRNFNQKLFEQIVWSSIQNAISKYDETSHEVIFSISKRDTDKLPNLLDKLEEKQQELGWENLYIREPSLGDIFLDLIKNKTEESTAPTVQRGSLPQTTGNKNPPKVLLLLRDTKNVSEMKLFWFRVLALLQRQYYSHTINKFTLIFYFSIPFIICIFAAILFKIYVKDLRNDPRIISIDQYRKAFAMVSSAKRLKNERSDIVQSYRKAWKELPSDRFYFRDLLHHNLMDYVNDYYKLGSKMKYLLIGMHVGAKSVIAKFNSDFLHTDQTSLALVHNAILRSILTDLQPKIEVTLYPLPSEFNILESEMNIMRFISFCMSLGLWFVFGLSTTGISFDKDSFSTEQHNSGLTGSTFWVGYILVAVTKLLIVIPFLFIFLYISDYRILLSARLCAIFIVIMVLGAFYFQFVKMIFFILFYEIERKYIITIFLTIVSIIAYNFTYVSYTDTISLDVYLIFLPLNIIARLFFFTFHLEAVIKMCKSESIYYVSVYAEKCKVKPRCCGPYQSWQQLHDRILLLILIIFVLVILSILFSRVYRATRLYTCRKIPLLKPYREQTEEETMQPEVRSHLVKSQANTFDPRSETLDTIPLFFDNVGKRVKHHDLVNNVSFILKRGDCFCIIGPHGEEKQMLLRLMSGNIRPSYGRIFCFGENAITKFFQSKKVTIGYCLPDLGRVHFYKVGKYMEIYALSVGIPRRDVSTLCKKLAEYIDILEHYDKIIAQVSTTTKRRMAFVMSFIGFPKIIIMDISLIEIDSNGSDLIKTLINWYLENNGTLILSVPKTSSGILYGTRLGIFINGRMRAVGSLGTICERLAHGYLIVAKIDITAESDGRVFLTVRNLIRKASIFYCSFVESKFHGAQLKGNIGQYIFYFIPYENASFKDIYTVIEENKVMLKVVDYYITQNTLDHVIDQILEEKSPPVRE